MIRLCHRDEPGDMETGLWLGRSARGQGIGAPRCGSCSSSRRGTACTRCRRDHHQRQHRRAVVLRDCGAKLREDDGRCTPRSACRT